jgi:hypothetical protein
MLAFPAGSQDNASIFDIGVQVITSPDIQAAAKRAGKNDLAFG